MPRYELIEIGVPFQASLSDLVAFHWHTNGITADFVLPHDLSCVLRVTFPAPCIVRILDEMPLNTEEEDEPNEGLVSERFAYRMHGARFAKTQSPAWQLVMKPVGHYQFVTGWACLDVLSQGTPTLAVIEGRSSHLAAER